MNILGKVLTILRNSAAASLPTALRLAVLRLISVDAMNPKGAAIRDIRGSERTDGHEFPMVAPGRDHTVLYYVHRDGTVTRPPQPLRGRDQWDGDYLRLPCSEMNKYPVEHPKPGEDKVKNRWHMIKAALGRRILDSKQLAEAILSYNHTYRNIWKFKALHALFDSLTEDENASFFHITLPAIATLALELPELIQSPIPLLKQGMNHSISLSQQQIACLLANAFFCTFPRRNSTTQSRKEYASYPHINFVTLYEPYNNATNEPYPDVLEKLKCLLSYFRRVTRETPIGVVTFTRRSVPEAACPRWDRSETRLSSVPLHVDSAGMIERAQGLIQLDFANKYIGGGVLGHGSVQEEIRFVTCPELMASMLFTEVLKDNEALVMIGAERFNDYIGYGSTFEWAGVHPDGTARDSSARRNTAVLAIDALPFRNSELQFKRRNINRELNKAWVGFSAYGDSRGLNYPGVATGNWGCGAFRGSPPLKSLIQLMACAEARRPIAYFTFHDEQFRDELYDIYGELCRNDVTVGELYSYILWFADSKVKKSELFPYLRQVMADKSRRPEGTTTSRDAGHRDTPQPMDTQPQQEGSSPTSTGLRTDSPDLFSPDEEFGLQNLIQPGQPQSTNQNQETGKDDLEITDYKITDSDIQLFETSFDNYDSDVKMSDCDKLSDGTKMSVDPSPSLPDACMVTSDSEINLTDSIKMSESDIRRVNTTSTSKDGVVKISGSEVRIIIKSVEDDTKLNTASHSKYKDETTNGELTRLSRTKLLFDDAKFTADSETKLTDRTKLSRSDIRGNVNSTTAISKDSAVKMSESEVKAIESVEDDTKSNTANHSKDDTINAKPTRLSLTKLLFQEMHKFDEANGLNMSLTKTPNALKRNIDAMKDSDVSMETDEKVVPPEPKKRTMSKKITDYFHSNPM